MSLIADELAYSYRRLRLAPGFAFFAVITLALGIGANSVLFSLINGLLLKSVPVPNIERLVLVTRAERATGNVWNGLSDDELRAVNASGLFDQVIIHDPLRTVISGIGEAEVVGGELVSGNYFQALGVVPRAGRLLQPTDDLGSEPSTPIVIGERLWRRWLGADPAAVGGTARLAGHPVVIVGIAPESFCGTWLPTILCNDVWVPAQFANRAHVTPGSARRQTHRTLATLAEGMSLARASQAVEVLGQFGDWEGPALRLAVLPGRQGIFPSEFDHYGVLLGAGTLALSGLVFLIACANLTNLVLARVASRRGELALRMALGASRRDLVRLLLIESLLLVGIATVVSGSLTVFATSLLAKVQLPTIEGISIRFDASPDVRVLGYLCFVAMSSVVAIGLAPSWMASQVAPWRALVSEGGNASTRRSTRTRHAMVVAQVMMSMIVVVVAGLYVRSALKAVAFNPGYDIAHTATASVDLALQGIDESRGRLLLQRLLEVARAIPHVRGAALVNGLPGLGSGRRRRLVGEDGTGADTRIVFAQERFVSPGLFDTLGIRIAAGRDFTNTDVSAGPAVVVVSQRVAAILWPEQHPIGWWLKVGSDNVSRQIVGVVADTASGVGELAGMAVYLPTSQAYSPQMSIVISTDQRPHSVLAAFKTALVNADRAAGVFDVRTLADSVGVVLAPIRAAAVILGCLGLIAGALAVLGIYGAMAYFVSQRTREFGVRRALGATRLQIYAVPVRQGLRLLVWGVVGGLLPAFTAVGLLEPLLYGVPARDIPTFVTAPAIIIIAGLATCILAARGAAVAEPSVSLREL